MSFTVAAGVELHAEAWRPQVCDHPVAFVLVHGLASNAAMWRGVARRLESLGHAVVAVDQRGHGLSTKPDGQYDVATFAADLAELVNALPFSRPALVGQSFGGNVVLELAAGQPDLVSGVACVDGGWIELADRFSSWEACESALAPPVFDGRPGGDLESLFREHHPDWPEEGIEALLASFEVRSDGTVAPWLSRSRHLQILRSLWEHHPSRLYQFVRVPALLVPAVNSGQPPGSHDAERAARLLPLVRLEPMAGDHDLHAQHPEAIAELLHDWADNSL